MTDRSGIGTAVLPAFGLEGARVSLLGHGLINQTFLLEKAGRFVLQRVSTIFPPAVNENIRAVTARLAAVGLTTPMLVPTKNGDPCLDLGSDGVWRVMTFVDGVGFEVVQSVAQARAAGAMVARFHAAIEGIDHPVVGMRAGAHDTARHVARLETAITAAVAHRLYEPVRVLAGDIVAAAAALPALPTLGAQLCHGDLKFNNFLFAGATAPARDQAVCLIDLDTVGPMSLAHELGDALRSWCNRAGEDECEASLDLEVLAAALDGYRDERGRSLSSDERWAMLLGPEWISLELAARFATDALVESYFGWNAERFPARGEHNLVRARGQWSLHRAFVVARAARAKLLGI